MAIQLYVNVKCYILKSFIFLFIWTGILRWIYKIKKIKTTQDSCSWLKLIPPRIYILLVFGFLEITSTIRLNQSGTQNNKSDKINLLSYYMYYVSMKFEFSLLLNIYLLFNLFNVLVFDKWRVVIKFKKMDRYMERLWCFFLCFSQNKKEIKLIHSPLWMSLFKSEFGFKYIFFLSKLV